MNTPTPEIACNRFGLGARAGELAAARGDPRAWLMEQLRPLAFDARVGDSAQALRLAAEKRKSRADAKQPVEASTGDPRAESAQKIASPGESKQQLQRAANAVARDTLRAAVSTTQPFAMRLLDFFSNHFSVSGAGLPMRALAPTLEREAIAPHIGGRFEDMLLAVEQHPAMLVYLNNARSSGPQSRYGKRHGRGLNENLAREILELHTLGVDGGYTQDDVRQLAMGLTGWTTDDKARDGTRGFRFRAATHEPGARTLLGKRYAAGGVAQGEDMLRALARHPGTARHLAFKLARHLVADQPPAALVDGLEARWRSSDGSLIEVADALLRHPAAWASAQEKLKTPREFVVSAARALGGAEAPGTRELLDALEALGQSPFTAGSPAGFGDVAAAWDGAEALLTRIDWAARTGEHTRRSEPLEVARAALGAQLGPRTGAALRGAASRAQALALLLMSPEFQRR
jgi:uncharacterized protein (DUF1800 family)